MHGTTRLSRATLVALLFAPPALAHGWDDCDGWRRHGGDGRYCEVRELTLDGVPASLRVDGRANGGVSVTGWDRQEVRVEARVTAWAGDEREARRIVEAIRIDRGPILRAEAPEERRWSVSYRIHAPRDTDLDLVAENGGLGVRGVRGELRLETHNGGVHLENVAGDVRARTTNGGVDVLLDGSAWEGAGLDVVTRNGGVGVTIPEEYSAELEVGTVNGRLDIAFPVTVRGNVGRRIRTTLGAGGAPVRVVTTNGSVSVGRR